MRAAVQVVGSVVSGDMVLTTEHASSSHGQPVLVDRDGQVWGLGDLGPQAQLRVRSPGDLLAVQAAADSFPHLGLGVAHGGARGGGAPRKIEQPKAVSIRFAAAEVAAAKAVLQGGESFNDFVRLAVRRATEDR